MLDLILDDGSVYPEKGRAAAGRPRGRPENGHHDHPRLLSEPRHILRPGQYGKVRAALEVKTGALLVPQRAVIELQGGYRVAVVGADGKADVRVVEPGPRVGDLWVIDKGLEAGEYVVVSGLQYVRAGMTVKAKPCVPETASASPAAAPRRTERPWPASSSTVRSSPSSSPSSP